jgi:phosphoribosylanthranilate isomerase
VGFNFYPRSPRYIPPEHAAEIATSTGVRRVGVFVNEKPERVEEIARIARLDVAQLHGNETPPPQPITGGAVVILPRVQPETPRRRRRTGRGWSLQPNTTPVQYPQHIPVWKALPVRAEFNISLYDDYPVEALLLDSAGAGAEYGGLGRTFDWSLVRESKHRIILAGGLDPSNIALAIARVRPWGVDCCSRIEKATGKKDHKKMKELLHAAMLAAL